MHLYYALQLSFPDNHPHHGHSHKHGGRPAHAHDHNHSATIRSRRKASRSPTRRRPQKKRRRTVWSWSGESDAGSIDTAVVDNRTGSNAAAAKTRAPSSNNNNNNDNKTVKFAAELPKKDDRFVLRDANYDYNRKPIRYHNKVVKVGYPKKINRLDSWAIPCERDMWMRM